MKLYGYAKKDTGNGLLEMKEVSVSASPDVLRKMAAFLLSCADRMERDPMRWEHDHFNPTVKPSSRQLSDLIVCNPKIK